MPVPTHSSSPAIQDSRPLWLVTEAGLPQWLERQPEALAAWVRANGIQAERGRVLTLPTAGGTLAGALLGLGALGRIEDLRLWHSAGVSERLPPGSYHLEEALPPQAATHFLLGWHVGAYRFARYRPGMTPSGRATLVAPAGAELA